MVKLDANILRYMSREEFRVLTALEMGMKNHEIVPTTLICRIAALKSGGAYKVIRLLHKNKLIYHDAKKYDGYKLTYAGYDYLALKALVQRGTISGIGRKLGVGKESDIYEVVNAEGRVMVIKIHRLGRISFRKIKEKRDYLIHRTSASWLYMSRLAAIREFAYMRALYDHGFPTPVPYDHSRHCIVMSQVDGYPFTQVRSLQNPEALYNELMRLIVRLAEHGLIHCDFNEFNLMISDDNVITMIDFPQIVSTSHADAVRYFNRDVQCIVTYFSKKFKYDAKEWPEFKRDLVKQIDLDKVLEASGAGKFTKEERAQFEAFLERSVLARGSDDEAGSGNDDGESDEEEEDDGEVDASAFVDGDGDAGDGDDAKRADDDNDEAGDGDGDGDGDEAAASSRVDWTCDDCGELVFARRDQCRKCKAWRPGMAAPVVDADAGGAGDDDDEDEDAAGGVGQPATAGEALRRGRGGRGRGGRGRGRGGRGRGGGRGGGAGAPPAAASRSRNAYKAKNKRVLKDAIQAN